MISELNGRHCHDISWGYTNTPQGGQKPTEASIGGKNGHYGEASASRPTSTPNVLRNAPTTVRRVFDYLYALSDDSGFFELNAEAIATTLGLSRPTIYRSVARLKRVNLLHLVEYRTGRGQHSLYQVNWRKPKPSIAQSVSPLVYKKKEKEHTLKTETCLGCISLRSGKDESWGDRPRAFLSRQTPPPGEVCSWQREARVWRDRRVSSYAAFLQTCSAGSGVTRRRRPEEYLATDAQEIILVLGARLYRQTMQNARLSFSAWPIPEKHRDALEGFYGLRIDGANLLYAQVLFDRIFSLRDRIIELVRAGASPRRVCSYVAGVLAGVPDKRRQRALREVQRRTVELMTDLAEIERRMASIRAWAEAREREFLAGEVCPRCGHVHTQSEFDNGRNDEDDSLNCFGWARIMIDRLRERMRQLREQQQWPQCRRCKTRVPPDSIFGDECFDCLAKARRVTQDATPTPKDPLQELIAMLSAAMPKIEV